MHSLGSKSLGELLMDIDILVSLTAVSVSSCLEGREIISCGKTTQIGVFKMKMILASPVHAPAPNTRVSHWFPAGAIHSPGRLVCFAQVEILCSRPTYFSKEGRGNGCIISRALATSLK